MSERRTTTESKSSSKNGGSSKKQLELDPLLIKKGRKLALQYRLLIEADDEAGYVGCAVEMPLVFGEGKTIAACAEDTLEALAVSIAVMLKKEQRPPSPAREGKREHQLNVRLTADERMALEAAASRAGFRSISDFVRAAALDKAS